MEEKRMPARYRMDETGQMRRTWNGKLPEEFNDDTDSIDSKTAADRCTCKSKQVPRFFLHRIDFYADLHCVILLFHFGLLKPSLRGALQSAAKEAAARPAPEGQRTADKGAR